MRPCGILGGLLGLSLAFGCERVAYELKIEAPKEITAGSPWLFRVEVADAATETAVGTQGDELCLLASSASGALSCAATTCTTEDMGRRLTMRVPLTTPRIAYVQYTSSGSVKRDILGVSVYQASDCSTVASHVPLTSAAVEFDIK